jgi:hypothetical protein
VLLLLLEYKDDVSDCHIPCVFSHNLQSGPVGPNTVTGKQEDDEGMQEKLNSIQFGCGVGRNHAV